MTDFTGVLQLHVARRRQQMGRQISALSISSSGSISSINEADFPDDWQPDVRSLRTSLPHTGFARNQSWDIVQKAVLDTFLRKPLPDGHLHVVLVRVRALNKSDIGPFIYDYFQNQLLKKGCRSLRDAVKRTVDEGCDVLTELGETWDYFFREALPLVQVILHPLNLKDLSIRETMLVGFRKHVLFHFDIEAELKKLRSSIPPAIQQMLLVLQGVCESDPPSESFLRLENLVAMLVNPYLGYGGLYQGSNNPSRPATRKPSMRRISQFSPDFDMHGREMAVTILPAITLPSTCVDDEVLARRKSHARNPSTPAALTLSPVVEVGSTTSGALSATSAAHSYNERDGYRPRSFEDRIPEENEQDFTFEDDSGLDESVSSRRERLNSRHRHSIKSTLF